MKEKRNRLINLSGIIKYEYEHTFDTLTKIILYLQPKREYHKVYDKLVQMTINRIPTMYIESLSDLSLLQYVQCDKNILSTAKEYTKGYVLMNKKMDDELKELLCDIIWVI